jgi:hypothetical protein
MSKVKDFFDYCPMPEPPPQRWRHFYKPIVAFAALTTILAVSLFASSFMTFTSSVAAPLVDQVQDQIEKTIVSQSTPAPTTAAAATASHSGSSFEDNTPAACTNTNTVQSDSPHTVSGYVLDANGCGIEGAEVIFCVPDIIPAVFTNASGYYQASAPAGTYHVYVWPPFNSSYISFEQKELVVNSNVAKNMTLNTGYKLSGYIKAASGQAICGAVVSLDEFYFNGYYSTVTGYYYIVAPAGTYTLLAHPKTGVTFPNYSEANVVVNGDASKNITIASSAKYKISGFIQDVDGNGLAGAEIIFNVPDIIPGTLTTASGYYEVYAPAGTYHVTVWPPFDSNYLSYDQPSFTVAGTNTRNFTLSVGYKVSGYITDTNGNPISGAIALLDDHLSGWFSKDTGYYFVTAPIGTYTLSVQPRTGPNFATYILNNLIVSGNIVQNVTVTR